MICKINTEYYLNKLQILLQKDFNRFKSYKNVVEYISSLPNLTEAQRINAIYNFANIYKQFAVTVANEIDGNGAVYAIDKRYLVNQDPTKYLDAVYYNLGLKVKSYSAKYDEIIDDINKLNDLPGSLSQAVDIDPIVKRFEIFLKTTSFVSPEHKQEIVDNVFETLISVLETRSSVNPEIKPFIEVYKRKQKELFTPTYISLDDPRLEAAKLKKTQLVTLAATGEMLEVVQDDNKNIYEIDENGNVSDKAISQSTLSRPLAALKPEAKSNSFSKIPFQILKQSNLLSNFNFKPLNDQSGEFANLGTFIDSLKAISKSNIDVKSRIKFFARPTNSNINASRVNRIHNIAKSNPDLTSLLNRKHETFESEAQQNALAIGTVDEVVTIGRPNEESSPFNLIVRITPDLKKPNEYIEGIFYPSYANYFFVKKDNTTEPVDFTNPIHHKRFAWATMTESPVKTNFDDVMFRPVVSRDIAALKQSQELYQNFQSEVLERMDDNENADVTDVFFKHYHFQDNTVLERVPLTSVFNKKSSAFLNTVTVVNTKGVKSERLVGFSFIQRISTIDSRIRHFEPLDIYLKDGESILLDNEKYSYAQYVSLFIENEYNRLGLKMNPIEDVYEIPYDTLKGIFLPTIFNDRPYDGRYLILDKSISRNKKYASPVRLELDKAVHKADRTIRFLTNFHDLFTKHINNEQEHESFKNEVEDFVKNKYNFNVDTESGLVVRIDFAKYNPALRIFGTFGLYSLKDDALSDLVKDPENEKLFSMLMNANNNVFLKRITNIYNALTNSKLLEEIVKADPKVYENVDFKTSAGLNEAIFRILSKDKKSLLESQFLVFIEDYVPREIAIALNAVIEQIIGKPDPSAPSGYSSVALQNLLKKTTDPVLKASYQETYDTFINYIKQAQKTDNINLQKLLLKRGVFGNDPVLEPSIEDVEDIGKAKTQESFSAVLSVNQFAVLPGSTVTNLIMSEKPTDNTPVAITAQNEIEKQTKINEEKLEKPIKKTGIKKSTKGRNDVLSLSDSIHNIDIENPNERQKAIAWFVKNYTMFGIDGTMLQELVADMNLDGVALGMFKDDVIYLNNVIKQKGVVYHEAFHAVFRRLMTQTERQALLNEIISDPSNESKFTKEKVDEFVTARNLDVTLTEAVELIAEEVLADQFKDYMLNNVKPKTFLQRLFTFLKDLIRFFKKNESLIDEQFRKISSGYFAVRPLDNNFKNHQPAFDLILGVPKLIIENGELVAQDKNPLTVTEQNELVARVAHHVLMSDLSFDEAFEKVTKELIKYYTVDTVLNQNNITADSEKGRKIIKRFEPLYKSYRFILGEAIHNPNYELTYIDGTNAPTDENEGVQVEDYSFTTVEGTEVDNMQGEYSKDLLKKLVRKFYTKHKALVEGFYNESDGSTELSEIAQLDVDLNTDNPVVNLESQVNQETEVNSPMDEKFNEVNRLESLPSVIRLFFAQVQSKRKIKIDSELEIEVDAMVDGTRMFSMLMQRVADLPVDQILPAIETLSYELREDGYIADAIHVENVFKSFARETNLDLETYQPRTSEGLYHAMLSALSGTELSFVHITVTKDPDQKNKVIKYSVEDFVTKQDVKVKKDAIIDKLISTHAKQNGTAEYKNALLTLEKQYKSFWTQGQYNFKKWLDVDPKTKEFLFEKNAELLYNSLKTIGINLPKSFVRVSMFSILKDAHTIGARKKSQDLSLNENFKKFQDANKDLVSLYKANRNLAAKNEFINGDFISTIIGDSSVMREKLLGQNTQALSELFVESDQKSIKKFEGYLRSYASYIIKRDPSDLPSVIRNSERKLVYRYTKWFPIKLMTQDLKNNGLLEFLESDEFYQDFNKAFYKSHPMASLFIKERAGIELTEKETEDLNKFKGFIKNFDVSLYGGASEKIGKDYVDGQSFNNIDDKSLYLLNLIMFADRQYVTLINEDGTTQSNVLYKKSYSTLEASQTNFLMTSMYEPFYDKEGDVKVEIDKVKRLKITETLLNVVKQEYERIQNEYAMFDIRLQKYKETGENFRNFFIKDYNVKKENGELVPKGRAYTFTRFPEFWNSPVGSQIQAKLIASAKQKSKPIAFDQLTIADKKELAGALENYAIEQFNKHVDTLLKNGLIEKKGIDVFALNEKGKAQFAIDKHEKGLSFEEHFTLSGKLFSLTSPSLENLKIKSAESKYGEGTSFASLYKAASIPEGDAVRLFGKEPLFKRGIQNPDEAIQVTGTASSSVNNTRDLTGLLKDSFYNHWYNSLVVNSLFEGDRALNVKNTTDYFKRNKKHLASGPNMFGGYHNVAVAENIKQYIHPLYVEYGPYNNIQEIQDDFEYGKIPTEELRDILIEGFNNPDNFADVFDGQSISSLMHQMDEYKFQGRLNDKSIDLLIAKHYRSLTKDEVEYLKSRMIVNNPKKTVYASKNVYLKQSEAYIDRNDVSELVIPDGMTLTEVYEHLHSIYADIYKLRAESQLSYDNEDYINVDANIETIKELVLQAHTYFEPLPHRKDLHYLLNSMEYHQIDQFVDPNASKNATILPVNLDDRDINGYTRLDKATMRMDNKFKFIQVETSGVKDVAKVSVQNKILIAADLSEDFLKELVLQNKGEISDEDVEEINNIVKLKEKYLESLHDVVDSNMNFLTKVIRKGENFNLGRVYDLIRQSLIEQGAPTATIQKFATRVTENGSEPILNPNLPDLRNTLEYYFFSEYSRHATDEKSSGFKSIHVSQAFMNVLEDKTTGNVITTEYYKNNKEKYPSENLKIRPLRVSVEKGTVDTYWVECIVPMPYFKDPKEKAFYMENLRKAFATRIPTEDKRSMIALKIVDFVDSSQLNTIIVPHFIHILAGSDFDVDALYGQTLNYYKGFDNEYHLYGDYKGTYEKLGKYQEFLYYMSQNNNFKDSIQEEFKRIKSQNSFTLNDPNVKLLMENNRINKAKSKKKYERPEYQTGYIESLQDFNKESLENANALKKYNEQLKRLTTQYNSAKTQYADSLKKESSQETRDALFQEITNLNELLDNLKTTTGFELKTQRSYYNFYEDAMYLQAVINVLKERGMPYEYNKDRIDELAQYVTPAHQNRNLRLKLAILSNKVVFENLYIKERSSLKDLISIVQDVFGIDRSAEGSQFDPDTIDGVIATKSMNSQGKDGIGQTAVMNKILGILSQIDAQLDNSSVVWKFNTEKGVKYYDRFSGLNEDQKRVIALVGNILGMFADNAKDPLAYSLKLNNINTPVTLTLLGLGMDPRFVFGLNYAKEIVDANQEVLNSIQVIQTSVDDNGENARISYREAITDQMNLLLEENPDIIKNLISVGLLSEGSTVYKPNIDKELLYMDFEPGRGFGKTDKFKNNNLSFQDIGYKLSVTVKKDKTGDLVVQPLTKQESTFIMLAIYRESIELTSKINKIGTISNLFKKLDPKFDSFDRIAEAIDTLFEETIPPVEENEKRLFTVETMQKMFNPNSVWNAFRHMKKDIESQAELMFFERGESFKWLKQMFGSYFKGKTTEMTKVFNSSVILYAMRKVLPKQVRELAETYKQEDPLMYEALMKKGLVLEKVFDPRYWYYNSFKQDLMRLLEEYPDNPFLQSLMVKTAPYNRHTVENQDKSVKQVFFTNYRMSSRNKLTTELAEEISDSIEQLNIENPLFVRQLFYEELVRTGIVDGQTTYLKYIPAELWRDVSNLLGKVLNVFQRSENFEQEINDFFQEEFTDVEVIDDKAPKVVSKETIQPGLHLYKNALTQEEQKQFFEFGKSILEKHGFNPFPQYVMASAGQLEWSPEVVVGKDGKDYIRENNYNTNIISQKKKIKKSDGTGRWAYHYYTTNLDGTPITPIPANIIAILEKITGQDMSDYDTVLINLYPIGRTLGWHTDVSEDHRNLNRDIISVSIGANADFTYSNTPDDFISGDPTGKYPIEKPIQLASGDIISFGDQSRLISHTVTKVSGTTNLGTINLSNSDVNEHFKGGHVLDNWRLNFTFRVADPNNNKGKRFKNDQITDSNLTNVIKPVIDLTRKWTGDLDSAPVYDPQNNKVINTMRTKAANPNEHFGNPFSEGGYKGTIKVDSIEDAVLAYKDWLLYGVTLVKTTNKVDLDNYLKPFEKQREWILEQINQGKLDGATLLYAGKLAARGKGMHPTALAEVVERLRTNKSVESTSSEQINFNKYFGNSGGARGADMTFDEVGRSKGFKNFKHFYMGEKSEMNAPGGNEDITSNEVLISEGKSKVAQAAKAIWGYEHSTMKDERLIRNWAQVKYSDNVYAVAPIGKQGDVWSEDVTKDPYKQRIIKKSEAVQGGTGYAVEMAIQQGKRVYVFNDPNNKASSHLPVGWYTWDGQKFVSTQTPVLSERYAAIGSRNISDVGRKAIEDLYDNTILNYSQSTNNIEVITQQPFASPIDNFVQHVIEKMTSIAATDPELPAYNEIKFSKSSQSKLQEKLEAILPDNFDKKQKVALLNLLIDPANEIKLFSQDEGYFTFNAGLSFRTYIFDKMSKKVEELNADPKLINQGIIDLLVDTVLKRMGVRSTMNAKNEKMYYAPLIYKYQKKKVKSETDGRIYKTMEYVLNSIDGNTLSKRVADLIVNPQTAEENKVGGELQFEDAVSYKRIQLSKTKELSALSLDKEALTLYNTLSGGSKVSSAERDNYNASHKYEEPENTDDKPINCDPIS